MIKWDENGTHLTAYGELKFKRWVRWRDENGVYRFGGIHLLRSNDHVLCVQLAEEVERFDDEEAMLTIRIRLTDTITYVELGNDDERDVYVFDIHERFE